jgi:heme-degrading monooxygenase HmoA
VPTRGDSPAVRESILQDRAALQDTPGLISHEIYLTTRKPITYVSVHSWRHLSDLHRFRKTAGIVLSSGSQKSV